MTPDDVQNAKEVLQHSAKNDLSNALSAASSTKVLLESGMSFRDIVALMIGAMTE